MSFPLPTDLRPLDRTGRVAAILILLGAFFLRIWELGAREFWFDEAASIFVADRPPLEVIRYVLGSVGEHPPLYYLLLNLWHRMVGQGEFALRFLSLICNLLFVAVTGRIGFRLGGARLGLLAMLVAAIQPFAIYQAQENRMYSLLLLMSSLTLWMLLLVLEGRRGASLGLVLACVVGMATSYFFASMVLGVIVVLLWKRPPVIRRYWPLILAAALAGTALLAWVALQPGPNLTLRRILWSPRNLELMGMNLGRLLPRLAGDVGLAAEWQPVVTVVVWGLALVGVAVFPRRLPLVPFFLAQIPWLVLLPWLDGRYWSSLVPVIVLAVAATLGWLSMRSRLLYAATVALLLGANLISLNALYDVTSAYFGAALTSVREQFDNQRDTLVISEPDSWVQIAHYGKGLRGPDQPLSVEYFPQDASQPLTATEVENRLNALLATRERIVLGPVGARNRDPESMMERYLLDQAFAVSRTFWPDGTLMALFVSPRPLEPGPRDLSFSERVLLRESALSSLTIPAGDAIAARLVWESRQPDLPELIVSLSLADERQQSWAVQQSAPCNGWCPSTGWQPGAPVTDNRALIVPSDVPPGNYQLLLHLIDGGSGATQTQPLGSVTVLPTVARPDGSERPIVEAEGVELLSAEVALPPRVRAGDRIPWSVRSRVAASARAGWQLRWALEGADGAGQRWQEAPTRADYPPDLWEVGRAVRGQGELVLDGTLPPGSYRLTLTIVDGSDAPLGPELEIDRVVVEDRPRTFELPSEGVPTDGRWQQGVRLRATTFPESAAAGAQLPLTLIWQAGGPTDRPYKVTVQLRDGTNTIVAQQDDFPLRGEAQTNSWAEGEVIRDEYLLELAPNLPSGRYTLHVALYDPTTFARLPLEGEAGDDFLMGTIEVAAP